MVDGLEHIDVATETAMHGDSRRQPETVLQDPAHHQRATKIPVELGFDLLRIYLGIGLFVRGALFVAEPGLVTSYLHVDWFWPVAIAHYVALAHLAGGLMLAAGFYTRLAAGIQLPALVGAVFFVHLDEGLFTSDRNQSLELSALVLVMLLVYTVFGAGPFSVDRFMRGSQSPRQDQASAAETTDGGGPDSAG